MSQSHVTLAFPSKWPADANALAEKLPPLMPELLMASDLMGTIQYCRFRVLNERTLLFLADFDGEFSQLMAELAKRAGPVFDSIFEYVENPPLTPVASQAVAFVDWAAGHPASGLCLQRLPGDRCADQAAGRRGGPARHGSAASLPGDPARQVSSRLRRDAIDSTDDGEGRQDRPGFSQRRDAAYGAVRAARK